MNQGTETELARSMRHSVANARASRDLASAAVRDGKRRRRNVSAIGSGLAVLLTVGAVSGIGVVGGAGRSEFSDFQDSIKEGPTPMAVLKLSAVEDWPVQKVADCGSLPAQNGIVIELTSWDDRCIASATDGSTAVFKLPSDPSPTGEDLADVSVPLGDTGVRQLSDSRLSKYNSRYVTGVYSTRSDEFFMIVSDYPADAARIAESAHLS